MKSPMDKKGAITKTLHGIEVHPDAWDRFRQAVHVMTKAGPQHRIGGATVKSELKTAQPEKEKALRRNKDSVKKKVF